MSNTSPTIKHLRGRMDAIQIAPPATADYRRSVWTGNRLHWKEKPAIVVKATTTQHVESAIILAKLLKCSITVKNTGHSYAGWSNNTGGILVDVSGMRYAELNELTDGTWIMTVGGGCIWGDTYKLLSDSQNREGSSGDSLSNHVVVGGRCPSVGVCGFMLGGGLSPFTRSQGLGMDMLREVTIVTAKDRDGDAVQTVTCNRLSHPRLFRALLGGGGGQFGVVTQLKFEVPKLEGNGQVVTGRFVVRGTVAQLIGLVQPLYTNSVTNQKLTIDTSWLCTSETANNGYGIRFTVYYDGDLETFKGDVQSLFGDPDPNPTRWNLTYYLQENTHQESCSSLLEESLEEHWSDEQRKFVTSTNSYHLYTSFVFEQSKSGAHTSMHDIINRKFPNLIRDFQNINGIRGTDSQFQATVIHGGGAGKNPKLRGEAFPWRQGEYFLYITVVWNVKHLHHKGLMQQYLDEKCRTALEMHAINNVAAFINFGDRALTAGDKYQQAYYGANYQELQYVKHEWDPNEVFKFEQGIKPQQRPSINVGQNRTTVALSAVQYSAPTSFGNIEVTDRDTYTEASNKIETAAPVVRCTKLQKLYKFEKDTYCDYGDRREGEDIIRALLASSYRGE